MALIEDALEVAAPAPMALGVGLALAAPTLLRALRPLAKVLVRGGLYITDSARSLYAEAVQPAADGSAKTSREADAPPPRAGRAKRPAAGQRRKPRASD